MTAQPITMHAPSGSPVMLEEVSDVPALPVVSNVPFLLCHHPQRVAFEVIEVEPASKGKEAKLQGYWLPMLVPFSIQPGVNGVEMGAYGPDYSVAKMRREKAGWIFIDPKAKVGGEQVLRSAVCAHPKTGVRGQFYFTVFDTPRQQAGRKAIDLLHDDQADARWRHQLVVEGRLPVPDEQAIQSKMRQLEAALAGLENRGSRGPGTEARKSDTTRRLQLMATAMVPGAPGDPLLGGAK